MQIQFRKYKRLELDINQRKFLSALVPYALIATKWIYRKAVRRNISTFQGLRPSVMIADILVVSDWGRHPAARPQCERKAANNLLLLEANQYWVEGNKSFSHEGKLYRSYSNWENCFEDISDYFGWKGVIDHVMVYPDVRRQVAAFASIRTGIDAYEEKVLNLIQQYGLDEFDLWQNQ